MNIRPAHHLLAQRRHRALNTLHTILLAGGSLVLLAVTAWVFGGPLGLVMAIVFGAVSMAALGRVSPQMVLAMYKAQPVARQQFPQGVELVEELARRAGLPAPPRLYVVPSRMLNAFAVGRRDDSAIAITDALVHRLTLRELAGVLSHEVSHVAHEDVRVMAIADIVSRYTSIMSTVGIFSLFLNLGGAAAGYEVPIPWLGVLVLVLAPTIGGLLQLALSRTREFDADLGAAMLTGDPDGLAMALTKLERAQRRGWETLMLPGGRVPDPSILRSHPPTTERVARLMALKGPLAGSPSQQEAAVTLTPAASGARSSLVPRIRRRPALPGADEVERYVSMMRDGGVRPLHDERADAAHAPPTGLCRPEGEPRLRLRRGGVWW